MAARRHDPRAFRGGGTAKLRMHFDLRAPEGIAAEVARLQGLGATVFERHEGLVVMQDPEGHEFCVED